MKQNTPTPLDWPPLIYGHTIPWYIRVRDMVLTALAWLVMGWMLRHFIHLGWDYARYPVLKTMDAQSPDWNTLWVRILPYLILSAMLITSVWIYGYLHRNLMRNQKTRAQPEALPLDEHAEKVGLDSSTITTWRSWPVITIQHDKDDRITGAYQNSEKTT
jgi:poly-beta-1,6-N-acetyl-D-glucosamine biosynthesis protein PgaD